MHASTGHVAELFPVRLACLHVLDEMNYRGINYGFADEGVFC